MYPIVIFAKNHPLLKISRASASSSISCTKCFEELTLRNKLIEVKENFKKKQLALDVLKNELTDLRKLVQKQVDDKSLFCEVCSKAVAEDMLLQHICRQNVVFLPCEYCNEPFSSTEKMLHHLETVHNDETQKYECVTCQKTFYMGLLYRFHQEIVHFTQPENIDEATIGMEFIPPKVKSEYIQEDQEELREWKD